MFSFCPSLERVVFFAQRETNWRSWQIERLTH